MPDRRTLSRPSTACNIYPIRPTTIGYSLQTLPGGCYKQFRPWDLCGDLYVCRMEPCPFSERLDNNLVLVGLAADGTASIDRCA